MLTIRVPLSEALDEATSTFIVTASDTLNLEHSLVSLSKWESFFEKPFLGKQDKSEEEMLWYVNAMILTPNPPEGILQRLSKDNWVALNEYISAKMTATTFREDKKNPSKEIITAELIYYWMITLNIPFECQHWHLNRLLTLVNVCNLKNAPQRKLSKAEQAQQAQRNRELNAQRRAELGTKG